MTPKLTVLFFHGKLFHSTYLPILTSHTFHDFRLGYRDDVPTLLCEPRYHQGHMHAKDQSCRPRQMVYSTTTTLRNE